MSQKTSINKKDLKDIVHKMISLSMQQFDVAFDDSSISEEDRMYAHKLIHKYEMEFENKIKDEQFLDVVDVNSLVQIALDKQASA